MGKRVINYVEELMKNEEYKEIKFNSIQEKDEYKLKFYGRLYVS